MRKSDYNFILTPTTVGEFIKRIQRLQSITGCLSEHAVYKSKELGNLVFNHHYLKIKQTIPSYLVKGKMSFDTYPAQTQGYTDLSYNDFNTCEGIIIRIHSDACIVFYWGQKFKFTPTHIKTVGTAKIPLYKIRENRNRKLTCIFAVYSDVERAKAKIREDELYAQQYWEDCDREFELEFIDS